VSGGRGRCRLGGGQLARSDCRVIGIVGGYEKCRYVTEELRFDAAID